MDERLKNSEEKKSMKSINQFIINNLIDIFVILIKQVIVY